MTEQESSRQQALVELTDDAEAMSVLGVHDRNLKLIREHYGVKITARGHRITLDGESKSLEAVLKLIGEIRAGLAAGTPTPEEVVDAAVEQQREQHEPADWGAKGLKTVARTPGQLEYLKAIADNPIVLAIGPAGTGKTYLAVRMAVDALKSGSVKRIVLCRPAVEAGEKLGFLPGDFQAKVNPYLRPLYDALNELLDYDHVRRYTDRETIEVAPLAYMRGRTLSRAFIILDEAQNTTRAQMKMLLTRMGNESRMVVNGDVTQVDLPHGQPSGLLHARRILTGIRGVAWVELGSRDIVRNPLVSKIVEAYERNEGASGKRDRKPRSRKLPIQRDV